MPTHTPVHTPTHTPVFCYSWLYLVVFPLLVFRPCPCLAILLLKLKTRKTNKQTKNQLADSKRISFVKTLKTMVRTDTVDGIERGRKKGKKQKERAARTNMGWRRREVAEKPREKFRWYNITLMLKDRTPLSPFLLLLFSNYFPSSSLLPFISHLHFFSLSLDLIFCTCSKSRVFLPRNWIQHWHTLPHRRPTFTRSHRRPL